VNSLRTAIVACRRIGMPARKVDSNGNAQPGKGFEAAAVNREERLLVGKT